jgi:hypothetical protein
MWVYVGPRELDYCKTTYRRWCQIQNTSFNSVLTARGGVSAKIYGGTPEKRIWKSLTLDMRFTTNCHRRIAARSTHTHTLRARLFTKIRGATRRFACPTKVRRTKGLHVLTNSDSLRILTRIYPLAWTNGKAMWWAGCWENMRCLRRGRRNDMKERTYRYVEVTKREWNLEVGLCEVTRYNWVTYTGLQAPPATHNDTAMCRRYSGEKRWIGHFRRNLFIWRCPFLQHYR